MLDSRSSRPNTRKDAGTARDLVEGWNPGDTWADSDSGSGLHSIAAPPPPARPTPADSSPPVARVLRGRPVQRGADPNSSLGGLLFGPLDDPGLSVAAAPGSIPAAGCLAGLGPATVDLEPPRDRPRGAPGFPSPGETLGGFRLISELGRGAFARVYLAEQSDLGRRPVALKVSRAEGDEPQILARLQHTHIVPIHSVHDDPATGLRLMCMPYFGGANLARVLEATWNHQPTEATGQSLVEALDQVAAAPPTAEECGSFAAGPRTATLDAPHGLTDTLRSIRARLLRPIGEPARVDPRPDDTAGDETRPARRFLRTASYIRASAWIAARLAEGLDHAHSRGLLHRDLKPSNILVAADGTPMLLDFNLAADHSAPDPEEGARAMVGGTLPYMAPEHIDAFNPDGETRPDEVGPQADLYALGLILFEMVVGAHPFAELPPGAPLADILRAMTDERRQPPPSAREANPAVPYSLDAIIRKCLEPDLARRYRRAWDLAEDLRRFLDDRPNKFAPEPSLRERAAKWARRNPRACAGASIAGVAAAIILALGGLLGIQSGYLEAATARLNFGRFQRGFQDCQFRLNVTSGPVDHLAGGLKQARAAQARYGLDADGRWRPGPGFAALSRAEQQEVRGKLLELVLLEARAQVALAQRLGSEEDREQILRRAIDRLERAESIEPATPAALFADRARYHAALGQAEAASRDRQRADRAPTSCRDLYLLGTSLLAEGKLDRAERLLERAAHLDPTQFWAWFALGLCHYEQHRDLEAAGDFATSIALEPRFAWPYLNRGLALARAGRLDPAILAYDRALEITPEFAEARVARGLARLELDDLDAARVDLARAVARGRREPEVLAALAESLARLGRRDEARTMLDDLVVNQPDDPGLRVARGVSRIAADPAGARADLEHALAVDPYHARAHLGMALLLRNTDPEAALGHAEQAIRAAPGLVDALQLRMILRARRGDPSAVDDLNLLIQSPTPHRLYNAACALAILSRTRPETSHAPRALGLLRRALAEGFPPAEAAADPDLDPIRDLSGFPDAARR